MAKKKHLSDIMRKRENKEIKENPFEIKINKRRHEVLGQKVMKWEKGRPGVSKSKWMKERMGALLAEHQNRNKDNRIKDKPKTITNIPGKAKNAEEKFKVARKNLARLYNLGEDDEESNEESIQVTHKGRLLSEIEKFDDLEEDTDDEEEEKVFREKFSEVQFGGPTEAPKGKKDLSQLIFDSILEKNERNRERRKQALLKEKIIKEFEENMPAFNAGLKKGGEERQMEQMDDLMIKLMVLKNARRCTPADQVASPEKEKVKEEMMERERLARMNPPTKVSNHRSADALDDDEDYCLKPKSNKRVRFSGDDEEDDEDDGLEMMQSEEVDNSDEDDDDEEGEEEDGEEEEEGDDDDEGEGEMEDDDGEEEEEVDCKENKEDDDRAAMFAKLLDGVQFTNHDHLHELVNQLHELAMMSPLKCAMKAREAIFEHHLDFQVRVDEGRGRMAAMPKDFKIIFLFHVIGNFYSTSDRHHSVVTPAFHLMSQLMVQGFLETTYDIAYLLLICAYFFEYVRESKRILPEAVNQLVTIISLHSSNREKFYMMNIRNPNMLQVMEDLSSMTPPPSLTLTSTFAKEAPEFLMSEGFKICSLLTVLELSRRCFDCYSQRTASILIFQPMKKALEGINTSVYPPVVKEKCQELLSLIGSLKFPTQYLMRVQTKPISLPQYAPKLKEDTRRKRKAGKGVKREELKKYKRLEKGIRRDIRKEQNLKNKIKFDEMVQEKHMRSEKTKKIINDLANQEGEFNAFRKKKLMGDGKKGKVVKL